MSDVDDLIDGIWVKITCYEREQLIDKVGRSCNGPAAPYRVFAGRTDVDREIYTEWGNADTAVPLLRDWRWPNSNRPCEHYAFVPAAAVDLSVRVQRKRDTA